VNLNFQDIVPVSAVVPKKKASKKSASREKASKEKDVTVDAKGIRAKGTKSSTVCGTGFMSNGKDFVMSSYHAQAENYEKRGKR
jgi:hypothetical protein